ncbi:LPS export ABC transporter periplasmic protein LptC [Thioalkalivibrio denitrificans]|uniref:LPS export ABC transporter periplasmic protein LptC n=1 Tax=Thioalkalivibrio denitrificans TaxID=108003 RepID=A0A1V3NRU5_9GAMM|nr:LPS export ABC transporter periplasmic protein LptC [Thioalkalivibrio denitrificans]OOG27817.1 LPS export ABC transporter periplasmic protein LptC [Thioalkalivibrio denitrificans]
MRLRHLTLVLVVSTVTAVSYWLSRDAEQRLELLLTPGALVPELFMEDFISMETGPDGLPRHRLSGQRMDQYRHDGSSQVQAPVMILHGEHGIDWTVVSELAHVSPAGDEVYLQGEVHMARPAGADHPEVDIHTRDVTVWPQTRQAHSDEHVAVRSSLYHVDGTGMRANLQTSVVELLHDADGTYFP